MKKGTFQTITLTLIIIIGLLVVAPCWGAADGNEVSGLTAWALGGDGIQELRVGWSGLLPDTEFAVAGLHRDAPDGEMEEWPIRGYAIAHALTADLLATVLKTETPLPAGALYAGLFAEYTYDRDQEWSGGYVVGGLLDVPNTAWQAVVEYQATEFNASDNDYLFVAGLRRMF